MVVMKFGGSSVANREQIEKVVEIVRSRLSRRPIIVSSAHKGITDALVQAAYNATRGKIDAASVIEKQKVIAASLGCPQGFLDEFYREIEDLLRGISLVGEATQRSLDYISSFGERMSVRCLAAFFEQKGIASQAFDVWDLGFITDDNFGNARPLKGYEKKLRACFEQKVPTGIVPVITGFVGKSEDGSITTVGRNGSDLTATLIAGALHADEVEIWSDTNGIMTANPRIVSGARNIPKMHFDEAAELAYFGSQVLHPSTLLPAMRRNIPVRVLNTNQPEHPGTVVKKDPPESSQIATSIAYKKNQAVLSIYAESMLGQAGFLGRVFEILGRYEIVVDMISTSEVSVSMTTDSIESLNLALKELEALGHCEVHAEKTILVVVGYNMRVAADVGQIILEAMSEAQIKTHMLSYGLKSINFAMLIDDHDITSAVQVLHRKLFEV